MNKWRLPKIDKLRNFFLFPSMAMLLLAAALFLFWGWVVWPHVVEAEMTDFSPIGFPVVIRAIGLCPPSYMCVEFNWWRVIVDIAFWYVVSAVLIHTRPSVLRLLLYFFGALLLTAIIPIWFFFLDFLLGML